MKRLTDKKREWLWFSGLWTGGLLAAIAASSLIKLAIHLMR